MRKRSKQEQVLAFSRAFNHDTALTEKEIYLLQKKYFAKGPDEILNKAKELVTIQKPNKFQSFILKLIRYKVEDKLYNEDWSRLVTLAYKQFPEPTYTRNLHAGNLVTIFRKSKHIIRFKDDNNVWRYYLI
jgi:hypothetical protein